MELKTWLNSEAPAVAEALDRANQQDYYKNRSIGFAGKQTVYRVLDALRAAMFPGLNETEEIAPERVNLFIGNNVSDHHLKLVRRNAVHFHIFRHRRLCTRVKIRSDRRFNSIHQ